MTFPKSFLQEVKDNNELVSLVESYVELKRAGSTYTCRCPFHSERTPSFHVFPNTQSYYCFGCQAGGDAITFIRSIENLDYVEAVKFLAQRAGLSLPDEIDNGTAYKRRRLYEMNREAGKFFHRQLFSDEGKPGRDYIFGRQLTEHTIKRFGLGYAVKDFHKLHYHMRNLGFSEDELIEGSLLSKNNNRVYDKFINRIMFPIFDNSGKNVIGFGGRALESDAPAKYLNSSETLVFRKRDNLFALNYAKNSKADYFILCEGYMDVISMHQAGFDSAVATLGTAITSSQARLIERMGKKDVILSYDADGAGQKAASKGINLLNEVGITAKVLQMTGAKDPDEYIKKYGAQAFGQLIEKSGGAIDYELEKLRAGLDLTKTDDKSKYISKAMYFLAGITSSVERELYISKAAELVGISKDNVMHTVENLRSREIKKAAAQEQRNIVSFKSTDKINPEAAKLPREAKAEQGILRYVFLNPEKLEYVRQKLPQGLITDFNRRIFDFMELKYKEGASLNSEMFNEAFTVEEVGSVYGILIHSTQIELDWDLFREYVNILEQYYIKSEQKDYGAMSNDELLELQMKFKENKK